MGAVEVEQVLSGNLEISEAGQLKERDSVTGSGVVPGPLAMGCVIEGNAWERAIEVWKCILPGSSAVKAGQMIGKLLATDSHCSEQPVL